MPDGDNDIPLTPLPPGVIDITGDRGVLFKYHKKGKEKDPTPSEEMPFVERTSFLCLQNVNVDA